MYFKSPHVNCVRIYNFNVFYTSSAVLFIHGLCKDYISFKN
jgi:hypothetical protein